MKVSVVNLGCKVNRVESDTIALSYLSRGDEIVDSTDAELIVVNTCTVTGEAEKKTRKTIRRVLRDNAHARVVVTGCASAIDPAFFAALDERVAVVDKADLLSDAQGCLPLEALGARVGKGFPSRAAVKVQDGCNHACTYCIVHVARGRAWSRPVDEVSAEVRALAAGGVKEIVLSGIDLGSYAFESTGGRLRLGGLVSRLLSDLDSAGAPDVRLRISSIEPRSIDEEFVSVLAQADDRVCRHLHLPLQAGSDRVLREMHRPYTSADYLELVSRLRAELDHLSLTTDVIVGFPGETEADFADTLALARAARFSKVHVFRYSRREGTPAAARPDQVPSEVKERRAAELSALADELRAAYAHERAGACERVVVERSGWGMSESYYKVRIPAELGDAGSFVARLTDSDASGIVGVYDPV